MILQLDTPKGKEDNFVLYNRLGHAFIFAGEDTNAAICFETLIPPSTGDDYDDDDDEDDADDGDDEVQFLPSCDHCAQEITNTRFVCRVCDDGDLCADCHDLYNNADIDLDLPRCRSHTFLRVPRNEWHDFKRDIVLTNGTTRQQWLKGLSSWRGVGADPLEKEEVEKLPVEWLKRLGIR